MLIYRRGILGVRSGIHSDECFERLFTGRDCACHQLMYLVGNSSLCVLLNYLSYIAFFSLIQRFTQFITLTPSSPSPRRSKIILYSSPFLPPSFLTPTPYLLTLTPTIDLCPLAITTHSQPLINPILALIPSLKIPLQKTYSLHYDIRLPTHVIKLEHVNVIVKLNSKCQEHEAGFLLAAWSWACVVSGW